MTFKSARRAQHPFVGTLLSLSPVRGSELGSGGEAEEGSCCVTLTPALVSIWYLMTEFSFIFLSRTTTTRTAGVPLVHCY